MEKENLFNSASVSSNVSISLPAIPFQFSVPFYIVENRKDNKRRGEGKRRKSSRCPIERKHICANPSVYIVKSFWIGGVVSPWVGANNAIYQGFPDGPQQHKFPRNRDTTNYAPPIRKTIRYRSPRIRYETKRLSRKCFEAADSFVRMIVWIQGGL